MNNEHRVCLRFGTVDSGQVTLGAIQGSVGTEQPPWSHLLDAKSIPHDNCRCPQIRPSVPWGQSHPKREPPPAQALGEGEVGPRLQSPALCAAAGNSPGPGQARPLPSARNTAPGNTARGSPARRRTEHCAFQDWAASSPAVLGAPRPVARGGRGTRPHPAAPEAAASQSCLLLEQGGVPIPGDICSRHAAAPGVEQVGPATLLSDSRAPGDLRPARARWAAPRPPRRDSVAQHVGVRGRRLPAPPRSLQPSRLPDVLPAALWPRGPRATRCRCRCVAAPAVGRGRGSAHGLSAACAAGCTAAPRAPRDVRASVEDTGQFTSLRAWVCWYRPGPLTLGTLGRSLSGAVVGAMGG